MKRAIRILLALVLCLCMSAALADTYYVKSGSPLNLRDENTNEVLTTIPEGTALEPIGDKCTDLCAYVSYGGYSGLVLWNYLTRTPPGQAVAPAPVTERPTAVAVAPPTAAPVTAQPVPDTMTLKAVNAVIQRANSRNKAEGAEMAEMTVTETDNVIITPTIPRGKKLDYWVINGVRYNFLHTISSFRLTGFDQSWTFEAVLKKADSTTLHTPQAIQESRTGQPLVCKVVNGNLSHIKGTSKNSGGWMAEFDFTSDYINRATGITEKGGQLTAKIRATVPKGKKVTGWKFDDTELYPKGATVTQFVVNTLDTSMTYEPIFGKASSPTKAPSTTTTTITVTDPPPAVKYVTVTCIKCRISGGAYAGKTSAKVPVGTQISVTANGNSTDVYWHINGTNIGMKGRTIKRTIKTNTTIEAFPVIN